MSVNVSAQTFTWTGEGASDDWSDIFNWLGDNPPTSGAGSNVIFDDPSLRSSPVQNIGSPITLGNMTVVSNSDVFVISGSDISLDNGFLSIDGVFETIVSNNFNFTNDAGIILNNDALLILESTTLTQGTQTGGVTNVTGNGTIKFEELTSLPAHLNVAAGVTTDFSTGFSGFVDISNDFDTAGDVRLSGAQLDFVAGGTINGDVSGFGGTIRTGAGNALTINGTTAITDEATIRIDDNSTIEGSGSVDAFSVGILDLGTGATVNQDVRIAEFSSISGDSEVSP